MATEELIDIKTFEKLYDEVTVDVLFFKLDISNSGPNCFTNKNKFNYSEEAEYRIEMTDILKSLRQKGSDSENSGAKGPSAEILETGRLVTAAGDQVKAATSKDVSGDLDEEVDTDSDEFKMALGRLNDCLQTTNLDAINKIQRKIKEKKDHLKEDDIVVGVGNHLVAKLAGRAVTSKARSKLKCPCGCVDKPEVGKMYIGSEDTWFGEIDMFGRGDYKQGRVGVIATKNVCVGDTADESDESDGDQFKTDIEEKGVKEQVISQTIVFGWTEYNRHEDLSPFIPSLLIDSEQFLFFIYNPQTDTLLNSAQYINFFTNKHPSDLPEGRYAGIFILWLFLNHRIFFRKQLEVVTKECGFKKGVELANYKKLNKFKVKIQGKTENFNDWYHAPLFKKRKRSSSDSDH